MNYEKILHNVPNIAPDSHASFAAHFCNAGEITFKLQFDAVVAALTVADAIIPVISVSTALEFGESLLTVPLYNSAVSHYVNAWQAAGFGEMISELYLAGNDLIKLAADKEQRKQLLQIFISFEYEILSGELLTALLEVPVTLFELFIDVIVTMIQTSDRNDGVIEVKLVAG